MGIGVGTVLVVASRFSSLFVIGLPTSLVDTATLIGKVVIIVICAPIFEEPIFRDKILNWLDKEITDAPFIVAALINAVLFAIYHWFVYGGFLQAMGATFIGAGVVGFVLCYVRKYSNSILPCIIAHMMLNASILITAVSLGLVVA